MVSTSKTLLQEKLACNVEDMRKLLLKALDSLNNLKENVILYDLYCTETEIELKTQSPGDTDYDDMLGDNKDWTARNYSVAYILYIMQLNSLNRHYTSLQKHLHLETFDVNWIDTHRYNNSEDERPLSISEARVLVQQCPIVYADKLSLE